MTRSGYHLRAFSPTDPFRIEAREDFAAEHRLMGSPLFGLERPEGPCWTLTDGPARWAQPLACGGLEPQGQGRYAAWLFAADLKPMGWAAVARAFRRALAETPDARRVEATIRADGPARAFEFAAWLGFSDEGLMRNFGPDGGDYWLYARVSTSPGQTILGRAA